jgi:hypothetical protein
MLFMKEGGTTMQGTTLKQRLVATYCLLMLSLILLLTACGGGYSSPGSQPNGTPQATPTKGGYSIISLFDNEIEFLLTLKGW